MRSHFGITDQEWDEAGKIVLTHIRDEKRMPNWLPTFHNGWTEFERRVLALILNKRREADQK